MKNIFILFLLLTIPTLSLATSQRCADNYNAAANDYKAALEQYKSGEKLFNRYEELADKTTQQYTIDGVLNQREGKNYTQDIITAMGYLRDAITKTQDAVKSIEEGHRYNRKALDACYDDDYTDAKKNYSAGEALLSKCRAKLDIDAESLLVPNYAREPFELLSSVIRAKMADAAIYLIENEQIDLNYTPQENRPLLIIAAQNGATEIANALVANGVEVDIQKNGYTPLAIAGVNGNIDLFTSLFQQKASPFLLDGFQSHPEYSSCNIADLVTLCSYSKRLDKDLFSHSRADHHNQILKFLKEKELVPVCNLNKTVATVDGRAIKAYEVDTLFKNALKQAQENNPDLKLTQEQINTEKKRILNHLISQEVQAGQARRTGLSLDEERAEKQKELLDQLENLFPDVTAAALKKLLQRENLAELAQEQAYREMTVTEAELQEYYRNNPDKFIQSGQKISFEEARTPLKKWLVRKKADQELQKWLETLTAKAEIVTF